MGCQESKAVRVSPFNPANNRLARSSSGKIDITKFQDDEPCVNDIDDQSENNGTKRRRKTKSGRRSMGSHASLVESFEGSDRGGSASSKTSQNSTDSGLGLAEDYSFVITENSDPNMVRHVENQFQGNESLELGVVGTACPRRQSAREKRHEELVILQALREEGLIALPKVESAGGLSFDVVMDKPDSSVARPPAKLAKLEKRKKKKRVLTEEQINEKLERAERRRKEREQSKLEKIREWESKHEHISAIADIGEKVQKEKEIQDQKMDHVTVNREKKLQEIQEKIRKREEHAEKVRQRKLSAAAAAEVAALEGTEEETVPTVSHGIVQVQPTEIQTS